MKTKKEVIADLKANAKNVVIKGLTVQNVNVTRNETYDRLSLTLNKAVKRVMEQQDGSFEEKDSNVIFASTYAIGSVLKEDAQISFAVNKFRENPDSFMFILGGAKIDVIQEPVKAGETYVNPFAADDAETTVFEHDVIVNHVINIELMDRVYAKVDKLADAMLGI